MVKRVVDTAFWTDDKVLDMFSVEDKLFMLYLLTNPHSTQLGIYKVNEKQMAFELGYSNEVIAVLLDRFEKKYGVILYSKETKEIAIINYLKYSILKGGKPVEDLLIKEINNVKNKKLLKLVFNHLDDYGNLNETVRKIISIHIINDNENEVSLHESIDESLIDKKIPPLIKSEAREYGSYQNVRLTDEQYTDIKTKGFEYLIDRLSDYMESKGKQYSNHHATIMSWSKKEDKNATSKGKVVEYDEKRWGKIIG